MPLDQAVKEYLADAKARDLAESTLDKLTTIFEKQFLSGRRLRAIPCCAKWIFVLASRSVRAGKTAHSQRRKSRNG